jgi:hypothetical protein
MKRGTMTIEIHRPELEALILQRMERGGFRNVEDVLMQALQTSPMIDRQQEKSSDRRTGADLIQALQSSPYRELDIEPVRFRSALPARDVTF